MEHLLLLLLLLLLLFKINVLHKASFYWSSLEKGGGNIAYFKHFSKVKHPSNFDGGLIENQIQVLAKLIKKT